MIRKTFTIPGSDNRIILSDLTCKYNYEDAPLVVFVHGFKGFKDWGTHNLLAAFFAENGFRFLKFNFSHNGTTPDNPADFTDLEAFSNNTFSKELFDLNAVIDYACSGEGFRAAKFVYLLGHSCGGGISIIKASEDNRVKKLATLASVSHFNNIWSKDNEAQWRQEVIIYTDNARTKQKMPLKISLLHDLEKHSKRLNIISAAAAVRQPWLICHGDADTSVSIEQAYELKKQNNAAEILIIPGGNHVLGASHPYLQEQMPFNLKFAADNFISFFNA